MRDPCPADLPRRVPRPEASEARVWREARCLQSMSRSPSGSIQGRTSRIERAVRRGLVSRIAPHSVLHTIREQVHLRLYHRLRQLSYLK